MSLTIASPGDIIKSSEVNANFNAGFKLQGEKAINDVSATNSGVIAGSSQVLIDKFLDATGQNNTVDTGNTTADYNSTNEYYDCLSLSTTVLEPSFETVTNWTYSEVDAFGDSSGGQSTTWKTNGTYSYKLTQTTPTLNDYNQIAQTLDFTNINTLRVDVNIGSMTYNKYEIILGSTVIWTATSSGEQTVNLDVSSYSGNKSLIFRRTAIGQNSSIESNYYIDNIRTEPFQDKTIQSVATTIPSGMTKVFVTPLMYEALSTGDSITADVSIDNGSTYTEDVPLNEWTPITSTNGTSLILKANLNTNDGTTTPKVLGWRVLLE